MSEKRIITGKDVTQWPEYKAFRDRLGIPEIPTIGITIKIEMDAVKITQEYFGTEESKTDE